MENTVELIGYYGSDLTHAQSAWTSTERDLTEEKKGRIDKLLTMLATEGHHTPFEKSSLHFLVKTDIATHIQILKHRIGVSVNAESARYKAIKSDDYLLPADWKGIKPTNKIVTEFMDVSDSSKYDWLDILDNYSGLGNFLYSCAINDLSEKLGRKRAKESARFFKTYNSQISADVMFNWRSFYHFLKLRNSEHAQKEIKDVAEQMIQQVKAIKGNPFKETIKAFGYL